jgi:hypothetical protein
MYEFALSDYLRAGSTALLVGVVLGVVATLLLPVGIGGFFVLTLAILGGSALGGGVAELLQRTTRHKRGPVMQAAAACALALAALLRLALTGGIGLIAADLGATMLFVIAIVVAWGRLR